MKDQSTGLRNAFAHSQRSPISRIASKIALLAVLPTLFLSSCGNNTTGMCFAPGLENLEIQKFVIQAESNEVIAGKQGAIFAIPSGAFLDANGNPVKGEVQIELREANSLKDILAGGLITKTGSDLLASDGMYKIEAFQNSQPLRIDPNNALYAYLPNDGNDAKMRLYAGKLSDNKLDWALTEQEQEGLSNPDSKENAQKCKKCERMIKMAGKIKPGKKPTEDEYWAKRHYWKNGVLYFASSGSSKPVLSQKQLDECKDYLESSKKGRELLASVEKIKANQTASASSYYTYRITEMGWYNCDKLVKEELMVFRGKVTDRKGNPMAGAKVHLLCTDPDMRIHTATTAENGEYELKFIPGKSFRVYAFQENLAGRQDITIFGNDQKVSTIAMNPVASIEDMDRFLADLM